MFKTISLCEKKPKTIKDINIYKSNINIKHFDKTFDSYKNVQTTSNVYFPVKSISKDNTFNTKHIDYLIPNKSNVDFGFYDKVNDPNSYNLSCFKCDYKFPKIELADYNKNKKNIIKIKDNISKSKIIFDDQISKKANNYNIYQTTTMSHYIDPKYVIKKENIYSKNLKSNKQQNTHPVLTYKNKQHKWLYEGYDFNKNYHRKSNNENSIFKKNICNNNLRKVYDHISHRYIA